MRPIRVLVVDDSSLVREVLTRGLGAHPKIEVIGAASNPYEARDILVRKRPDAISLDIEMPRMDGLTFLRKYTAVIPTPTVVVSNLTTSEKGVALKALEAGALEVVRKPQLTGDLVLATQELASALLRAARIESKRIQWNESLHCEKSPGRHWEGEHSGTVVAIGASTGGVAALSWLLSQVSSKGPAVVVVQHMPEGLTSSLAERLNEVSDMEVLEGREGLAVKPGRVIIAPSNGRHTVLIRRGRGLVVDFLDVEKVCFQRPAVDVLFESVARDVRCRKVGVVLTGMGADGATGLLAIRSGGGRTLCQDESSSVVYGMPKAAWEKGAAERQCSLSTLPSAVDSLLLQFK